MKSYSWPGSGFSVKEDFSDLVKSLADAPARMEPIVKKHAFIIQAEATRDAPVDTGALKNSLEAIEGKSAQNWIIQDGVEYGVFQELGTSRGAAKHFLGGAAEKDADKFFSELRQELTR